MSTFRLYVLRGSYLMVLLFLTTQIWPLLFHHRPWPLMHGVANCLLAAMAPLFALGLWQPLKMLPVALFELSWKAIWLIAIGLPLWRAQALDADALETFKACAFGVVLFLVVIPWPYVWRTYVSAQGERWTSGAAPLPK